MHRVETVVGQVSQKNANMNLGKVGEKKDDDIVIVAAVRTAITKARRGGFKDTPVEEILAAPLKAVLEQGKVKPELVGDIIVGSVLGPNVQRANEARIAAFLAGYPDSVAVHLINRQCSSGIQAVAHVAANIKAGFYDIGVAAGVESMSTAKMGWEGKMNPKVFLNQQAKDCLIPMGITSENVAAQWKVTREEQDALAVASHAKATAAIKGGKFKSEIIPVTTFVVDPKTGEKTKVVIDTDEGARGDVTAESLAKLKPAFIPTGSTTAGNASQVSDGAAAVLLTTRAKAKELGLPIVGTFRGFSVAGVPPSVMGIGPMAAIPKVLAQTGLTKDQIDVYELNEAFASQAMMCIKTLGLDMKKINPNGGAIALGHPLGCTGARMVSTLLNELKRQDKQLGIISMCIGSGMGAAAVIENDK